MANIVQYAPMLRATIPLLLGVVCATQFSISPLISMLLIFLSAALFILLRFKYLSYPIIFGFGVFVATLQSSHNRLENVEEARVIAKVEEATNAKIIAIYSTSSGEWQRCNQRVTLYGDEQIPHTTVVGRVRIAKQESSFKHLRIRQIRPRATLINIESHSAPSPPLTTRINRWALARLERLNLSAQAYSLTAAMTLAHHELLSKELMSTYRKSGTSHIMALSGIHMSIVWLLVWSLSLPFSVANRGHLFSSLFTIIVVWLFAIMAGLGDSILRAAWMVTLLQLSLIFSKRYGSLNSMCVTLAIMTLLDPAAAYDLGFQLSFISVTVIVVIAAPITRNFHLHPFLLDRAAKSIVVSCIATLSITPIISHYFGYITLMSPISTLLLLPTLITIICTALLWILCPIAALAPAFRWVIEVATTIQNFIASWFSQREWGYVEHQISYSQVWISYLCILIVMAIFSLVYHNFESRSHNMRKTRRRW